MPLFIVADFYNRASPRAWHLVQMIIDSCHFDWDALTLLARDLQESLAQQTLWHSQQQRLLRLGSVKLR